MGTLRLRAGRNDYVTVQDVTDADVYDDALVTSGVGGRKRIPLSSFRAWRLTTVHNGGQQVIVRGGLGRMPPN